MQLLPTGLAYFAEVARTGSVTRAADTLRVAPAAISRQIAKLEADLGLALFDRKPRGMVLTDAGARLVAHARRSEAESAALVDEPVPGRTTRHGPSSWRARRGSADDSCPGRWPGSAATIPT